MLRIQHEVWVRQDSGKINMGTYLNTNIKYFRCGSFREGHQDGYGTLFFDKRYKGQDQSAIKISGFWVNHVLEEGSIEWDNGTKYQGQLIMSAIQHGFGKMTDEYGCIYEGQWNNGQFYEFGHVIFTARAIQKLLDGSISPTLKFCPKQSIGEMIQQYKKYEYKGSFKEGEFDGNGKLRTKGACYIGKFKNGFMHGKGCLIMNSMIHIGNWQFGKMSKAKVNLIKHRKISEDLSDQSDSLDKLE